MHHCGTESQSGQQLRVGCDVIKAAAALATHPPLHHHHATPRPLLTQPSHFTHPCSPTLPPLPTRLPSSPPTIFHSPQEQLPPKEEAAGGLYQAGCPVCRSPCPLQDLPQVSACLLAAAPRRPLQDEAQGQEEGEGGQRQEEEEGGGWWLEWAANAVLSASLTAEQLLQGQGQTAASTVTASQHNAKGAASLTTCTANGSTCTAVGEPGLRELLVRTREQQQRHRQAFERQARRGGIIGIAATEVEEAAQPLPEGQAPGKEAQPAGTPARGSGRCLGVGEVSGRGDGRGRGGSGGGGRGDGRGRNGGRGRDGAGVVAGPGPGSIASAGGNDNRQRQHPPSHHSGTALGQAGLEDSAVRSQQGRGEASGGGAGQERGGRGRQLGEGSGCRGKGLGSTAGERCADKARAREDRGGGPAGPTA